MKDLSVDFVIKTTRNFFFNYSIFCRFLIKSTSKSSKFIIVYNLIVEKDFKICKGN